MIKNKEILQLPLHLCEMQILKIDKICQFFSFFYYEFYEMTIMALLLFLYLHNKNIY